MTEVDRIMELAEHACATFGPPRWKEHDAAMDALRAAIEQALSARVSVTWDGNCVLGHCGSPAGCETSNCCRANITSKPQDQHLTRILAECYQVIGVLAQEAGRFDDESVIKALDNASAAELVHEDVLPFPCKKFSPQPPAQEARVPVQYLANGTRFKLSLDDAGRVNCFWNWKELDGRWVALVAAEDDQHLSASAPEPPAQEVKVSWTTSKWQHDCAALLQNDVELWVSHCPHCGKPATAAPQPPAQEARVPVASKGSLRDMMIDALLNAAPQPTAQREWVGFEYSEIYDAALQAGVQMGAAQMIYHIIEAKLREKNGGAA